MSTAHDSMVQVIDAILVNMPQLIKFPTTQEELSSLADTFYAYGYPNVVGAIDGTLIQVKVPDEHRLDYFTRKYITAINLTAVCDAEKRIMHINVGQSGRCHDSHIFCRSKLYKLLNQDKVLPDNYHIIGDAAYGLSTNVMVPYPGEDLPAYKERHNHVHSSTRMVVERCFSDLKNRWLRLRCMRSNIILSNRIVATCCCLHNLCIKNGDITTPHQPPIVPGSGNHQLLFNTPSMKRDALATRISADLNIQC